MEQTFTYIRKANNKNTFLLMFVLLFCIFSPKFTLIQLPGFTHGLRYEDIIIFLGFICICYSNEIKLSYFPGHRLYYIFYGILSLLAIISIYDYAYTPILLLLKWIEYSLYFVLLHYVELTSRRLRRIAFLYILVNFFLVVLQKYSFLGCISTKGYALCGDRPHGLTGGAWELPITLIFMLIPILYDIKIKNSLKIFYLFITSLTVTMTGTRTGIIVLSLVFIAFVYKHGLRKKIIIIGVPIILMVLSSNERMKDLTRAFSSSYKTKENYIIVNLPYYGNKKLDPEIIPMTLIARLQQWGDPLGKMKVQDYIFGKGLGYSGIFKEGMYVKLLTDIGIVGVMLFLLYYYRLLKNYKILALVLALYCLTIDALSASKIMMCFYFSLFYLKCLRSNYEIR